LFHQVEDCPVIVVEEDLCGVHCAREPSRVQEQSPSLLVLLLLGGKWHCILLIELSGVCCEVGQGSVECHWPCHFHSRFEDGWTQCWDLKFFGNGIFAKFVLLDAEGEEQCGAVALSVGLGCTSWASHGDVIIELVD
jgi:hypothetical protein